MARSRRKTIIRFGGIELSRKVTPKPATVALAEPKTRPPKAAIGKEIGVSGNAPAHSYGGIDSGEYVQKLQGAAGRAVYDEMRRSDPQVQSILKAIMLPLRQANYYVESASDEPTDREIAETAEADLFRNMTITWDDTVRHILLMLPFGFSVLEKIWEYRDEMIRPRKFDPRLPQSVVRWQYDTTKKRLVGPVQQDGNGTDILLPIDKLLVFTTDKEGDNWEGTSLLRPLYKPWYIKSKLEMINAIKHDRHGVGIPRVSLPAGVVEGSDEWDAAIAMGQDLHANEQAYIVKPDGWEVDILGADGAKAGTDAIPSIKYYDEAMSRAALTMFTMLGQTETGSRALGESFTDIFRLSLQAFADYICEVINRFALREYVDYNWEVDEYPELRARRIQQLDPQTLAIITQAGLVKPDLQLENALRNELNLPEREEEEGPDIRTEPDESTERDEPDEEAPEENEQPDEELSMSFADRELTAEELLCDFPQIELALDTATETAAERIERIRAAQIEKIAMQLVSGRKVQEIGVQGNGEIFDILIRAYKEQFQAGRQQVEREIMRQRPEINLADRPMPTLAELLELVEEELQIRIQGASDKLKTMIATMYLDLRKRGFAGDELASELRKEAGEQISDVATKEMASAAVNQGWGAGRQTVIEQQDDEVDYVYRSALMDRNTCSVCADKDGRTHEPDDPEYLAPDPECLGAPKCRCINIAVMKAESAPEAEQ